MPDPSAQHHALLVEALAHHQAGRLAQAEPIYRQILSQNPNHADALNLLGVIALSAGKPDVALALISKSVQLAPAPGSLNNQGEALRLLGRLDDAVASYQRSISMNARQVDAYSNLSLALAQQQKHDDAIRALDRAISLSPPRADLHLRRGALLLEAGDPFTAIAETRKAIELNPQNPAAHAQLGLAVSKKGGAIDDAISSCMRAIEMAPKAADAHRILGIVLDQADRPDDAADAFARAIAIDPNQPECYARRSTCFEKLGKIDEAVALLEEGIRRCPREPRLLANLSCLYRERLRFADAVETARRAIELAPAYNDAHGHLSLALLSLGRFEEGFAEYEWRWRCDSFTTRPRDFKQPIWDGSDLSGRTILVHSEQGFGDTLQFARYLPMLADRGATVIVECHHALRKLLARTRGVSRVIPNGLNLPITDLHSPMLSLPHLFGTTLQTIPQEIPYLFADLSRIEAWRQKLDELDPARRIRIGLTWAGNAKPDRKRTIPGQQLAALAGLSNVQFFSLQKKDAETYQPAPAELQLIDLEHELADFDETAAAMTTLDAVVTIDTGPAHLAGALSRPTFAMLPLACDWRWVPASDIGQWYSTMRLFKQAKEGDWCDVLSRVRGELSKLAK